MVLFGVLYGLILLPIVFYFVGDTKNVTTLIRMATGNYDSLVFNEPSFADISTAKVVPQDLVIHDLEND